MTKEQLGEFAKKLSDLEFGMESNKGRCGNAPYCHEDRHQKGVCRCPYCR